MPFGVKSVAAPQLGTGRTAAAFPVGVGRGRANAAMTRIVPLVRAGRGGNAVAGCAGSTRMKRVYREERD